MWKYIHTIYVCRFRQKCFREKCNRLKIKENLLCRVLTCNRFWHLKYLRDNYNRLHWKEKSVLWQYIQNWLYVFRHVLSLTQLTIQRWWSTAKTIVGRGLWTCTKYETPYRYLSQLPTYQFSLQELKWLWSINNWVWLEIFQIISFSPCLICSTVHNINRLCWNTHRQRW